jgi:hypothetical protein
MVEEWRRECQAELAAARAGQFRESAQQFLVSSWQGDALQVGAAGCAVLWAAAWAWPLGGSMPRPAAFS